MNFQFDKYYFLFACALLLTEIMIALYAHDAVIRPYGGDFLVVILFYCLVHSFFDVKVFTSAIGVLVFAYLAETLQYFHILNVLGLERSTVAKLIMGANFEWTDMLMYTLGILSIIAIEVKVLHKSLS